MDYDAAEAAPRPEEIPPDDAAPVEAEPLVEPAFDEIWRPGRRKEIRRAHQGTQAGREKRPGRGKKVPHQAKPHGKRKGSDRHKEKGQEPRQHREPRRERMNPEHSPFAALKELRDTLARERPEGS